MSASSAGNDPVCLFWVLVRRAAVLDVEVAGVLADIRAKAGVGDVLALVPVVADEYGDPSRACRWSER